MQKLKKGKYYVGDPCYIFKGSWGKVLNDTEYFGGETIVTVFGKKCAAGGTCHGDGTYQDNFGRSYWVDSGVIGVMPISLIAIDKAYTKKKIEAQKGMHIVDFKEDFEVSIVGGVFKFGDIVINTAQDEEDDSEW